MNIDFIYRFLAGLGYTHPLHPTITHLAIGLVMGALIFYLIAFLVPRGQYARTARRCSTLAFLAVFPSVILGLMDWSHYYGGCWMFPIQMKMILAGILVVLLLFSIVLNARKSSRTGFLLAVYLLCFAAVVGLGYFGGEIVYGKRAGREAGTQVAGETGEISGRKAGPADFAAVKKIFENNCTNCHTVFPPPKRLDLTSYTDIMEGSETGPVVISANPGESELIKRVKGVSTPRMPLGAPALPDGEIEILENWIHAGAPAPGKE